MIEKSRIIITLSLILVTITLILHLVAMGYPHWKVYEHRKTPNQTLLIGIFHRCEDRHLNTEDNHIETHLVCDDNKYCFHGNTNCNSLENRFDENFLPKMQYYCNMNNNPYNCRYSSITKGLISFTIISACTLGISLLLILLHIIINQFKYKIHMYIAIITIILLSIGFIFILVTLILLGSTMKYDLYQYRYNLDYRMARGNHSADAFRKNITEHVDNNYDIRLERSSVLEIIALIFSTFTIIIQILYLISIHRNRIG